MVGDECGEEDIAEVVVDVFFVAGGDGAPLFDAAKCTFDGVAFFVDLGSKAGGLLPSDPLALRRSIWSLRLGIVWGILRSRSRCRVDGCEYALSARSRNFVSSSSLWAAYSGIRYGLSLIDGQQPHQLSAAIGYPSLHDSEHPHLGAVH
jgi:hypothetical protein